MAAMSASSSTTEDTSVHPNRPETYASVCASRGFVKRVTVGATHEPPEQKERVRSATREACWRLWVTITTVSLLPSCRTSSSTRSVETGRGPRPARRRGALPLDRERPGDAQPLLLAAGEHARGRIEAVLDLVPQPRCTQCFLGLDREIGA